MSLNLPDVDISSFKIDISKYGYTKINLEDEDETAYVKYKYDYYKYFI